MKKVVNQLYCMKSWLHVRLGNFAKIFNKLRISLFAFYDRRERKIRLNIEKGKKTHIQLTCKFTWLWI